VRPSCGEELLKFTIVNDIGRPIVLRDPFDKPGAANINEYVVDKIK
jgi:hypothetical protein